MQYIAHYDSPLGGITVASDGEALTGLWFDGQKFFADTLGTRQQVIGEEHHVLSGAQTMQCESKSASSYKITNGVSEIPKEEISVFDDTLRWLDIYFSGNNPDFTPKIKIAGSPFRKRVWQYLLTIPYGHTTTYGIIARRIAVDYSQKAMSAQAVGGAVARNPISLIIPCHRVVGKNGSLTGYAGGIDKKMALLKLEGVDMSQIFSPII